MMPRKRPPFDIGEPVNLDVKFYDDEDTLQDPTGIALRLVCPSGTIINKVKSDLVQLGQGVWRYVYTVANGSGTYRGTWTAQGGVDVVRQFSFPVREPDSG